MLRSYALAPDTIRRFLRRTFWRLQIICGVSLLGFGMYLAFLARPIDWGTAGPLIGFIALLYFAIIFYIYREQLHQYYSERYELDDSGIIFRQRKKPPLHISRSDIIRIEEHNNGIAIATSDPGTSLLIPYGLAREGDTDFRDTLGAWQAIQAAPRQRR